MPVSYDKRQGKTSPTSTLEATSSLKEAREALKKLTEKFEADARPLRIAILQAKIKREEERVE